MPSIRLGRYEVKKYGLPEVCARCGEEAVAAPAKRFSWSPPWLAVLILLGLLGILLYVILAASLTKRMTVALPLCDRHRSYWRNRRIFIWGGLAAVVLIGILVIPLGVILDDKGIMDDAIAYAIIGTVGLFLIWLLSAAIVQSLSIRATEISDRSITLTHLSGEFVEAVNEDRRGDDREDEDEDDRPPRRRRREAEDEEDDRPRARPRENDDDDGYFDPDEKKPRRRPPPDAIEEEDDR